MELNNKANMITLPFKKRYFISNIKYIFNNIKYAKQRLKYGVSEVDIYEFGEYLNIIIENGLKLYKNEIEANNFYNRNIMDINNLIGLISKCNIDIEDITTNELRDVLHSIIEFGTDSEEYKSANEKYDELVRHLRTDKSKQLREIYNLLGKINSDLWI